MKAIRYFIAILLFCGCHLCMEAAERPGKAKKEKPVPEYAFKRFYVDVSAGYAFRLGANEINGLLNTGYLLTPVMFNPLACANVGKGVRAGVNIGFNFNRHVGLELNGGYLAFPVDVVSTNRGGTVGAWGAGSQGVVRNYDASLSLNAQRGILSFQVKASPGFARCNPYAKLGMGTIFGRLEHHVSLVTYGLDENGLPDRETGNMARYEGTNGFFLWGFVGAVGVDFYISPVLTFFLEGQAGMFTTGYFNWLDGKQGGQGVSEDGFSGEENVFGNNHGLNIGIKFKF